MTQTSLILSMWSGGSREIVAGSSTLVAAPKEMSEYSTFGRRLSQEIGKKSPREPVKHLENDRGVDESVAVQLGEELDHSDPPLAVLGVVHLQVETHVFEDGVDNPRAKPFLQYTVN